MKAFIFLTKYIIKFNKWYLFYALMNQVFVTISPLINVILPKFIVDELLGEKRLNNLICLIIILGLVNFISSSASRFFQGKMFTAKIVVYNKFSCLLAEKMVECDYIQLETPEYLDAREKAQKFIYGNGQGFGTVIDSAFNIIGKILVFIGLITVLSTLNIYIVIIFVVLILVNAYIDSKIKKRIITWDLEKAPIERQSAYLTRTLEDFNFGKEIRINNAKNHFFNKINEHLKAVSKFYSKQVGALNKSVYFSASMSLIRDIVSYGYLAFSFISSKITMGDFTMYTSAIYNFSQSMNEVMTSLVDIKQYGGYYEALDKFLNVKSTMRDGQIKEIDKTTLEIEFESVSFIYPGQSNYALKNVSIKIKSQEKLSIVGENGAGKTTFVKLLTRLYDPTEGLIKLNGVNIKEIDYNLYQSLISAVFQDYKLFSFTLKENIILDRYEDDKLIEMYFEKCGLGEKIKKLNKGIHTNVHKNFFEDGFEPSGGEGQKIALTRALYKNTPIIVLDEPTAALDPRAEYEMYKNFYDLVQGKTAIFISHRLSSSKFCDNIAVFDNGSISEYGTHDQLMNNNGLYKELFEMQAQFYQ